MLLSLILFFLAGLLVYYVDRQRPQSQLYRSWYNFWNKEKLPEKSEEGFVYQQSLGKIIKVSFGIAIIKAVLFVLFGSTIGNELLLLLPTALGLLIGIGLFAQMDGSDAGIDAIASLAEEQSSDEFPDPDSSPPSADETDAVPEEDDENEQSARERLKRKNLLDD